MKVNWNDILVVFCDVLNKSSLAALGANLAGFPLPPEVALTLIVVSAASGTVLTHLQPVGSRRADASD